MHGYSAARNRGRLTETPATFQTNRRESPMKRSDPTCPVCGAEAQTFYRDAQGVTLGCDECVTGVDWMDVAAEQGAYAEDARADHEVDALLERMFANGRAV